MDDLLYGMHPVCEGLRAQRRRPLELFLLRGTPGRFAEVVRLAEEAGVPVRFRERSDLDRMAGRPHHQGVVLRVSPFAYASLEEGLARWRASGDQAFFLVLDSITDPHNFGALLRSAEAAGCHAVIVPRDRFSSVTGVVDKASAGALEHLLLCQVTNLARTLEELQAEGVLVCGLSDRGEHLLYDLPLDQDLALVIGGEGKGLRPNVARHCDQLLRIPMRGRVSSLNASVAAGVALFEVVRQRPLR